MDRKWLAQRRKDAGLTQQELAEIVGVSNKYISAIEKGQRNPAGAVALKISKALSFDMHLFYVTDVHNEKIFSA